jgi:hypothetical protein
VKYLRRDIDTLNESNEIKEGSVDTTSCSSALVHFENPEDVVKGWAKLLKRGGRTILDVPTPDSMIRGCILDKVGFEVGILVSYSCAALDSKTR